MPALDTAACAELMGGITAIGARAAHMIRPLSGIGAARHKADGSPVTAADEQAEAVIRAGLSQLAPALPIVSEEQTERRYPLAEAVNYFLVDPLDGTREFIAGRDEYTINIALMTDGAPVLGVIAAPALGLIWRGIIGRGAERVLIAADGESPPPNPIHSRLRPERECIVLVSRSHIDARTQAYVDAIPQAKANPCGSALKFCRLAEGAADLYPRLAPTRDWDVAAGHAIVEAAGGNVRTPECRPLRYGTAELVIGGFIASGR